MKPNTFLVLLLFGIFQVYGINPSSDNDAKDSHESFSAPVTFDALEDNLSNDFCFFEEFNEEEEIENSELGSDSFLKKNSYELSNNLLSKYQGIKKATSLLILFSNLYILHQVFRI